MPSTRTQITLDQTLDRQAKRRARHLGISFAEYVRRLIARDVQGPARRAAIDDLFGIGDSGGGDVARLEDEYVADAFAQREK